MFHKALQLLGYNFSPNRDLHTKHKNTRIFLYVKCSLPLALCFTLKSHALEFRISSEKKPFESIIAFIRTVHDKFTIEIQEMQKFEKMKVLFGSRDPCRFEEMSLFTAFFEINMSSNGGVAAN